MSLVREFDLNGSGEIYFDGKLITPTKETIVGDIEFLTNLDKAKDGIARMNAAIANMEAHYLAQIQSMISADNKPASKPAAKPEAKPTTAEKTVADKPSKADAMGSF